MNDSRTLRKPLAIFDGECAFCRIWIEFWKEQTGDRVDFGASQDVREQFPDITAEQFRRSFQLVLSEGEVLSGARAVYTLLTYAGKNWPLRAYENVPLFEPLSELAYRLIAAHRNVFFWVTAVLFGRQVHPLRYRWVEWLFLRALALIYLDAFLSLGVQIRGLIGSHGVLPIGPYLDSAARYLGTWQAWRSLPTLFWIAHGDAVLVWTCIAGAAIAVVLLVGFLERPCLIALYVLYLSLTAAGQDFLSFQWDMLLLEAGFLAIFLGSSDIVVWLYRVLVFRLMFSSGIVKLLSGDPSWRNLTALHYHYFTQPIPTPLAWYMEQLPLWFQKVSTSGVFFVELAIPFFVFLPRRPRRAGAVFLIALQLLILTTGNYAFFNWLTIALCLFLLDDEAITRLSPPVVRKRATPRKLAQGVAAVVLTLGVLDMYATLGGALSGPAAAIVQAEAPFGIVNTYGLFAVMTTERPEITVQGSNDGVKWSDYIFRYKPGPLARRPPWVAPHQPRLDWQMWFAALQPLRGSPWFANFVVRLLEGSPDVLRLLETNPFPNAPPRYVRALLSRYRFTTPAERRNTGDWWISEPAGAYLRPISLADVRR